MYMCVVREEKGRGKRGLESRDAVLQVHGAPRPISRVTNLYEFAWFIVHKFNNGTGPPGAQVDKGIYEVYM